MFLVAISQALLIVSTPLQPVFAALTPATPELPIIWSSALFDDITSLIFAFGLAYMALGLTQARRYEGHARSLTLLFVTVLAIFGTVVGIVSVARIDLRTLTMSVGLAFYLASIVIFGVVRIVAWGYLTAAAAGGRRRRRTSGGLAAGNLGGARSSWRSCWSTSAGCSSSRTRHSATSMGTSRSSCTRSGLFLLGGVRRPVAGARRGRGRRGRG